MKQNMTCPKCGTEQAVSQQCTNCQIFFEKYYQTKEMQSRQVETVVTDTVKPVSRQSKGRYAVDRNEKTDLLKGLVAAAVIALLGAWLWKFIAVTFEYEFGFIAWGIGGLVGFAAASLGARGLVTGVLCALLAAGSIVGGKYMVVDAFRTELIEVMSSASEFETSEFDAKMDGILDELKQDARAYTALPEDETSLRQFMVDHSYSVAFEAEAVSTEEIQSFREYDAPSLRWIAQTNPTYSQWLQHSVNLVGDISVWDALMESFGLLDWVFLILGVFTAFRLGTGAEE